MELGYIAWFLFAALLGSAAYSCFLYSKNIKITKLKDKYARGIKNSVKLASGCPRCSKVLLNAQKKKNAIKENRP